MDERLNLSEARTLIPLLRSISAEVRDRRVTLARREALRDDLATNSASITPEGFIIALQDLDASIADQRRGMNAALAELDRLGLVVPSVFPLVVHIPGRTSRGDVVFCWEEGADHVEDGMPLGQPKINAA